MSNVLFLQSTLKIADAPAMPMMAMAQAPAQVTMVTDDITQLHLT